MKLEEALDFPLFEAVYLLATKGGTVGFTPCDADGKRIWEEAWAQILRAWRLGKMTVTGRPATGGFPEAIAGTNVVSVRVVDPFSVDPAGDPCAGTCPYISSFGRGSTSDVDWERRGLNDVLYVPGHGGWTHLVVNGEQLAPLLPRLDTVEAAPPTSRKRGRVPSVSARVKAEMGTHLAEGGLTLQQLRDMVEKKMTETYQCSRGTARKARAQVLSEICLKIIHDKY